MGDESEKTLRLDGFSVHFYNDFLVHHQILSSKKSKVCAITLTSGGSFEIYPLRSHSKETKPSCFSRFRHISLHNVLYKIMKK